MKRENLKFENCVFDVLIIGGGIHGCAVARECACAGLKVALVEKNDFGSETSANSLKIIHGGLRYLQHLNIKRMRESIISRRIISTVAPHCVKPLGCVVPNSGYGLRSNLIMKIALLLYDFIAFDRNKGMLPQNRIPGGKIFTREEFKGHFPQAKAGTIRGGSLWYDAISLNSERLTLSFVHDAVTNGAVVANYALAKEILVEKGVVKGALVWDSINNKSITIKAKSVVIAGGPWNPGLTGCTNESHGKTSSWAKAVNIIVKKQLFSEYALGLAGDKDFQDKDAVLKKKGRFFFFVPWRGYTMIGTSYTMHPDSPDALKVTQKDVVDFLAELNSIYPAADVTMSDVTKVHIGLLPAYPQKLHSDSDVQLEKETEIVDFGDGDNQRAGLFAIRSVKFTTAPIVARKMQRKLVDYLGVSENIGTQKKNQLAKRKPGKRPAETFEYPICLKERYGTELETVLSYIKKSTIEICHKPLLLSGEIDYFIEKEMAFTLSDVVLRRSELATAECPEKVQLDKIAHYMSEHFAWDKERIDCEVKSVLDSFKWE